MLPEKTARTLLLLGLMCGASIAASAERVLDHATLQRLATLGRSESITLDAFPAGPTHTASLRLQRVQIYAPDARLYVIGADGKRSEIPRSTRVFLRGYAADGSARVAMSLEPDGSFVEGDGSGMEGSFVVKAKVDARGAHTFSAQTLQSTLPSPDAFEFRCSNENQKLAIGPAASDIAAQLHLATTPGSIASSPSTYRLAKIGIDTDSLFMSRLFSNNTTSATNWIAGMFNSMNTMYENDLQVQLVIGTTILRTSAANDPYTTFTAAANVSTAELDFFGNYWRVNESSVPRAFAIMLSGRIASSSNSCSAAGKAWIDEYCQKGFVTGADTVGSYSVTKVCTSINVDPNGTFDARIVGHEVGHNFGAWHTHCTDKTAGNAPVAANTIDVCYNLEDAAHGGGCYGGATSCPAGGSGTIMSYCNFTSVSMCAAGTQNQFAFHATQISQVLLPKVAANTPSCLYVDEIFPDGFQ